MPIRVGVAQTSDLVHHLDPVSAKAHANAISVIQVSSTKQSLAQRTDSSVIEYSRASGPPDIALGGR